MERLRSAFIGATLSLGGLAMGVEAEAQETPPEVYETQHVQQSESAAPKNQDTEEGIQIPLTETQTTIAGLAIAGAIGTGLALVFRKDYKALKKPVGKS